MLRVDRSTIPTVPMPSLASPYLVRQSLSVALRTPVSLEVRKGLRVVLRPSPAFQLQSILLSLVATISGVLLLLHPTAFNTFPLASTTRESAPPPPQAALPVAGLTPSPSSLTYGAVLGRIQIARLHISALVREGADKNILQTSVGHIPKTGVAEQPGNFALAGHRETLFSSLRAIRPGDVVTFLSVGETYRYRVFSTRIVKETDISVLKSDGGFAPKSQGSAHEHDPHILTLITCYPFTPSEKVTERFIVQADLQSIRTGASASLRATPFSVSVASGKRQAVVATRVSKSKKAIALPHRRQAIARSSELAALVKGK